MFRFLRDNLVHAGFLELAFSVTASYNLDPEPVWGAWGFQLLKAGNFDAAKEKLKYYFSTCLFWYNIQQPLASPECPPQPCCKISLLLWKCSRIIPMNTTTLQMILMMYGLNCACILPHQRPTFTGMDISCPHMALLHNY